MKLVSENSAEDLAKERVLQVLRPRLRQLAANIIRVTRGAGKAYDLPNQMADTIEAIQAYRDAVGYSPSDYELGQAINIRHYADDIPRDPIDRAMGTIVQGALQIAASQLLDQSAQEAAGEREVLAGIRDRKLEVDALNNNDGRGTRKPRRT